MVSWSLGTGKWWFLGVWEQESGGFLEFGNRKVMASWSLGTGK